MTSIIRDTENIRYKLEPDILEFAEFQNFKGKTILEIGDAENLRFDDNTFNLVYSWGVLHHTPDTEKGFSECFRVLKLGGKLKVMIYHVPSWTGWMLWIRYGLLKGNPFLSPRVAIYNYLESPGTKAYTLKEAEKMLRMCGFKEVSIKTKLSSGDLLTIRQSKRYKGLIYKLIWKVYPRWLVRLFGDQYGNKLLIDARKI
jgi:ubiquinone/menaquinone biosynthesis C-methylase UbiE